MSNKVVPDETFCLIFFNHLNESCLVGAVPPKVHSLKWSIVALNYNVKESRWGIFFNKRERKLYSSYHALGLSLNNRQKF